MHTITTEIEVATTDKLSTEVEDQIIGRALDIITARWKPYFGSHLVQVEGYRRPLKETKLRVTSSVGELSTALIYETYGGKGLNQWGL